MNLFEKERKLAEFLSEKTNEGKLFWTEDGFSGYPKVKIGDHTIRLEEGRSANGATLYYISIMRGDESEIDRFHDENLDTGGDNKYFVILRKLFARAMKQASGADKAIDDILKNIGDL